MHATSNGTPREFRLGEILLREGMLERDELETKLAGARSADDFLGSYLVKSGRLTSQELQRALAIQVQELFHRLMDAENAIYRFQEGVQMLRTEGLEVNITQLLLESARKKDEERRPSVGPAPIPEERPAAVPAHRVAPSDSLDVLEEPLERDRAGAALPASEATPPSSLEAPAVAAEAPPQAAPGAASASADPGVPEPSPALPVANPARTDVLAPAALSSGAEVAPGDQGDRGEAVEAKG